MSTLIYQCIIQFLTLKTCFKVQQGHLFWCCSAATQFSLCELIFLVIQQNTTKKGKEKQCRDRMSTGKQWTLYPCASWIFIQNMKHLACKRNANNNSANNLATLLCKQNNYAQKQYQVLLPIRIHLLLWKTSYRMKRYVAR